MTKQQKSRERQLRRERARQEATAEFELAAKRRGMTPERYLRYIGKPPAKRSQRPA